MQNITYDNTQVSTSELIFQQIQWLPVHVQIRTDILANAF